MFREQDPRLAAGAAVSPLGGVNRSNTSSLLSKLTPLITRARCCASECSTGRTPPRARPSADREEALLASFEHELATAIRTGQLLVAPVVDHGFTLAPTCLSTGQASGREAPAGAILAHRIGAREVREDCSDPPPPHRSRSTWLIGLWAAP